jgi:YHS domain-containing protein
MVLWQRVLACLMLVAFSAATNPCLAADPAKLREELARLTSEVAERLRRIAEIEAELQCKNPPVGLEGYCPVTLVNESRWQRGKSEHSATYGGRLYSFVDAERQRQFEESPQKYAPVLGGCDPVLWQEKSVRAQGRRQHGLFYDGKIILFVDENTLKRFADAPERYRIIRPEERPEDESQKPSDTVPGTRE